MSARWIVASLVAVALTACDSSPTTDAGLSGDAGAAVDAGADAGGEIGPAHCLDFDLIFAAVDPGVSITLFNPSADPIAIDEYSHAICRFPTYIPLTDLAAGVTIAPGATHTLAWPTLGSFVEDDDAGGELALYNFPSFDNPGAQIAFVCWGTGLDGGRKNVAEMDGDWTGDCAPAVTGEALVRVPDTDGHSAASYDATGAAAALSCP